MHCGSRHTLLMVTLPSQKDVGRHVVTIAPEVTTEDGAPQDFSITLKAEINAAKVEDDLWRRAPFESKDTTSGRHSILRCGNLPPAPCFLCSGAR